MCKKLFEGESARYRYILDSERNAQIIDKTTGEVITDAARVAEQFGNLAAAFGVKIEKPKPPKSKTDKQKEPKHKYGVYSHVLLTDKELKRLCEDLGQEEAYACVDYIDEYIQIHGNKNHWKDFNLVVRKCSREQWHKSGKRQQPQAKPETSYDMELFKQRAEELPVYRGRGGS